MTLGAGMNKTQLVRSRSEARYQVRGFPQSANGEIGDEQISFTVSNGHVIEKYVGKSSRSLF
jgi:hypothetical protein